MGCFKPIGTIKFNGLVFAFSITKRCIKKGIIDPLPLTSKISILFWKFQTNLNIKGNIGLPSIKPVDEYHARYEDVFKEKRDKTPMLQTHDNQIFYQDLKKKVKDSPLQVNGVYFCNNSKIIWWLVAGQMQKHMSIQVVQKILH